MVSRQHQDWISHGKPDSGLALPLQHVANNLAAAGYVVYVYPNDAHLDAEPPEDHTYYSETGWPETSPKWWRHAIDIMPPPAGSKLPSLTQLGQTLFNARQAGNITWLKYMNWPSDGSLAHAVQDRWEPGHARGASSDTGHIHLSSTTGCEVLDDNYNPMTNVIVAGSGSTTGGTVVLGDDDILAVADAVAQWATVKGPLPATHLGAGANLNALNAKLDKILLAVNKPAVSLSADQIAAIASQVTTGVVAAHHGLDDTDKPVIEAAVIEVLKKGIQ